MAHSNQAIKRVRQDEARREHNRAQKTRLKTARKRFLSAVEEKDEEKAKSSLINVQALLDKAGKTNLVHHRKAARDKSRLQGRLNALLKGDA